jgi:peptidoglycan/xylan/chitin deacetylase (PgdA/CDA1 family)
MRAHPPARLGLWLYAAAGVALGGRALLEGPPPFTPTLLGALGYLAYGTLGVFYPERGMYGRVLSCGPRRPELALTFDDGPHPRTTPRVLTALAAAGASATFFVVGRKAEQHPELVAEIARQGHLVALHGYEHDRLFSLRSPGHVDRDIRRTQAAIVAAGAPLPLLFRPPIGFLSHFTVAGARRAGVTIVGCTARALDGVRRANPKRVAARLKRAIAPGAVLALHDAAERDDFEPASISALPELLSAIESAGLRSVTLSNFLESAPAACPDA